MSFDIGKHNFDRLALQAIPPFRFSRLHPGSMRQNEFFVLAPLYTPPPFFTRCTCLTKGPDCVAPICVPARMTPPIG